MVTKFPFPADVHMANVSAGGSSTAKAGGVLLGHSSSAMVRIEGPSASLYSVFDLEAMAFETDPDAPRGTPPSWQIVARANGGGPIDLSDSAGLAITINFTCPADPSQDAFDATAVVFAEQSPSDRLLEIPLNATLESGRVSVTGIGPFTMFAGTTKAFSFHLASSFRDELRGIFSCDKSGTSQFTSDTDPQFPSLPAHGSADVNLPVTCAAGTPPGQYQIDFRYRDPSDPNKVFGLQSVQMIVMESRSVSVDVSLASPVTLARGSSTPCFIRVTVSGGSATFTIEPHSVPAGVNLGHAMQTIAVDGMALIRIDIGIDDAAPLGTLAGPLILHWTVAGDLTHTEVSDDYLLDIRTTASKYQFGFELFRVENCRSKGDHNDVDTLIVVVANDLVQQPPRQVLLGNNLHAGNEVHDQFLGPFDIDHDALITVTFTVLNSTSGDAEIEAARTASAIAVAVGSVLGAFATAEEFHFLGLDASTKIETRILGAAGTVFDLLGGLVHAVVGNPNPDCSGAVLLRTFSFRPGDLISAPPAVGPLVETVRSPSDCGNDPHSTVIFAFRPL